MSVYSECGPEGKLLKDQVDFRLTKVTDETGR